MCVESPHVHLFLQQARGAAEFLRQQHLSFEVADLECVIESLQLRGETYEVGLFDAFEHRNYRWCEWRGPDEIRLECVQVL